MAASRFILLGFGLGAILLVCGCGDSRNRCTANRDCPLDFECNGGACERAASVDSSAPDAAAPDSDVTAPDAATALDSGSDAP